MTNPVLPGSDRIDLMLSFLRIVEAGSLSAAAQQLGTSQPTMSRRLQALERLLGVKLLQRSTHGMQLPEEGPASRGAWLACPAGAGAGGFAGGQIASAVYPWHAAHRGRPALL